VNPAVEADQLRGVNIHPPVRLKRKTGQDRHPDPRRHQRLHHNHVVAQ
jgi:hypothetical protein